MSSIQKSISILVPAFNEEARLKGVLQQLEPLANADIEVICINDGSVDSTQAIIDSFSPKVQSLTHPINRGKGAAIASGILKANGDIIVFVDADLLGDLREVTLQLAQPLLEKKADGVVGYPINRRSDSLFKPLSGERAYFRKDLLPLVPKMQNKGYGLELFLNHSFRDKKVVSFPLANIIHPMKYEKQSSKDVLDLTTREILEVLKEVFTQENPPKFFLRAYIYSFYMQDRSQKDDRLEKLFKRIQGRIKEYIDFT